MMVKQHIAETYGPIRYTIGAGSSGGSMQQHQIAAAYPGLLDGIQPAGSFPDVWETMQEAEDCHLLNHYFDMVSPHLWAAAEQQQAVTGYRCMSRRRVRIRAPRGQRVRSARVYLRGRLVHRLKGPRAVMVVDLRGLPRGRFTVRIVGRTTRGKVIRDTRRYRTRAPRGRSS